MVEFDVDVADDADDEAVDDVDGECLLDRLVVDNDNDVADADVAACCCWTTFCCGCGWFAGVQAD